MAGLFIVLLTAIGTGIAALSILGHPGWLWQILASVAVLNGATAIVVVFRRPWGRRAAELLLFAQIIGALVGLVVVAFVEIRDIPLDMAMSLLVFIFAPLVAGTVVISALAAISINRLSWPDT